MTGNLIMPGGAQAATQTYVNTAISNLVNAAPTALDTLAELSTALNNDASFATTVTNSIATKLALSGGTLTGQLTLTYSGARIVVNDGGSNGMSIGLWDGSNCRIESAGRPLYMVSYGGAISIGRSGGNNLVIDTNTLTYAGGTIWRDNNDGSGSGLDADLLDGRNGGDYAQINSGGPSFQGGITYTGWYKLARSNQNPTGYGPRGGFKITVAATGNYLNPAQDVIFGYKDWGNTIHVSKVESYLSTPFTSYRVTTDSDYIYLEGYVSGFWVGGEQSIAVYCESYGHNGLQWSPLSGYVSSGLSSPSSSFSMNKNGSATTYGSIFSSYSEVKAAADGNDLFVGRYSGGSAKLFRVYQSGADGYLELRTGADNIVTRLSGYAGTSSYFLSNVGFGTTSPSHRVHVSGNVYSTDTVFGRNLKPEAWASVSAGSPSGAGIPLGYSSINITSPCDNNWRTILSNINDVKGYFWVTLGDAASKDTANYMMAMTSPAYGVSNFGNVSYQDNGWNTGGFEFTTSSANGTYSLLVRCTSYYSSGATAYGTIYFLRME
jgi:hypothetical protein